MQKTPIPQSPEAQFQVFAQIKAVEKAADPDGSNASGLKIEGYASTKDVDRVGDVVEPGAFAGSLDEYMENPVLTFMHDWHEPIGKVLSAAIDETGLKITAWVSEVAGKVHAMVEQGIVRALSIGYDVVDEQEGDDGHNHIKALKLFEIAVVTIPANAKCGFALAKRLRPAEEPMPETKDVPVLPATKQDEKAGEPQTLVFLRAAFESVEAVQAWLSENGFDAEAEVTEGTMPDSEGNDVEVYRVELFAADQCASDPELMELGDGVFAITCEREDGDAPAGDGDAPAGEAGE